VRAALLAVGLACAGALGPGAFAQQPTLQLRTSTMPAEEICGTGVERARALGFRLLTAAEPRDPLSFEQSPTILSPDYTGTITLRRFLVAGDVPSIRVRLATEAKETQSWTRIATEQMAGQIVSVFEPFWPAETLGAVLRGNAWGWDRPGLTWGEVLTGNEDQAQASIVLRIAPTTLPAVRVQRVAEDVQYSANVVNIVIPDFGSRIVADDHDFEFTAVTQKFYQHFADSYDSVAVIPQDIILSDYGAFHRNVRNDVQGIGVSLFDRSAAYGSLSGRLRSVELFNRVMFASNSSSAHEIAHQWADYIDWSKLTGLARSGHQPFAHDPLWAEGETFIGSVLTVARRV
jgi:hypothetical protein